MKELIYSIGFWFVSIGGIMAFVYIIIKIVDKVGKKQCDHDFGNGLKYYKHVPLCLKCGIKLTDVK